MKTCRGTCSNSRVVTLKMCAHTYRVNYKHSHTLVSNSGETLSTLSDIWQGHCFTQTDSAHPAPHSLCACMLVCTCRWVSGWVYVGLVSDSIWSLDCMILYQWALASLVSPLLDSTVHPGSCACACLTMVCVQSIFTYISHYLVHSITFSRLQHPSF